MRTLLISREHAVDDVLRSRWKGCTEALPTRGCMGVVREVGESPQRGGRYRGIMRVRLSVLLWWGLLPSFCVCALAFLCGGCEWGGTRTGRKQRFLHFDVKEVFMVVLREWIWRQSADQLDSSL
jgi:hypothetical protein